jgi:hypothetical protein
MTPIERMSIWVTGSFTAFHHYPGAPDDVSYLREPHRHKFYWRAEIFINPAVDRELEFHQVQRTINEKLPLCINKSDAGSCEMMAKAISKVITEHITLSGRIITVSEDNECGSTYYHYLSNLNVLYKS